MEWLDNPDYAELYRTTPVSYRSTLRELILLQEQNGTDSRTIWASLLPDDSLKIFGQDLGPVVEECFGVNEYEYAHTIPSEYVHLFLELLGATEVKDVLRALQHFGGPRYPEISAALEQAKAFMPIQFWSRF
jgi:hypothetical protein